MLTCQGISRFQLILRPRYLIINADFFSARTVCSILKTGPVTLKKYDS